jgi:hypothetical protein
MSDRVLFSLMGLTAALMAALALVWPQGVGARSPGPFGHAPKPPAAKTAAPPASGQPSILSLAPAPSSEPAP